MSRHRPKRQSRAPGRLLVWHWGLGALGVAAVGAIAVAVVAGAWASRLGAPAQDSRPPATRIARAGPARLVVPADWQPAAPASLGIAGLDPGRTAVLAPSPGLSSRAVVTVGPVDHPSLIPRALRALLQDPPPRPRHTSLGGLPAWLYPALPTRVRQLEMMDLTVLPTTSGVVAVACGSPAHTWPATSGCQSAVQSASLPGAATLVPSPSVALSARLPAALARLDRERVDGRAALRRAETRTAQALVARRLADRHLAAADSLRPAHGAVWRSLVLGLVASGRAYAALGRAASDGSVARFDAARRLVRGTDARLASTIEGALSSGARRTVLRATASPPTVPAGPDSSRARLPDPLLLILVLAVSGAAGFLLSGPTATAAGTVTHTGRRLAGALAEKRTRRRPATTTGSPAPAAARPPADWRCEITWNAGSGSASFRAEATTPGDKPCVIAQSTPLRWPPDGPAAGAELAGAAQTLAQTLIDAGWAPAGSGPEWYARRFVWTRPEAPVATTDGQPQRRSFMSRRRSTGASREGSTGSHPPSGAGSRHRPELTHDSSSNAMIQR